MPRGGQAPKIRGVEPKHIYEAMLTGPQTMDTFSDGNLPPEEKRDVIAYLNELDEQPAYGGFGLGGLGPVCRGHVRLAGRHRRCASASPSGSPPTRPARTKEPSKGVDA